MTCWAAPPRRSMQRARRQLRGVLVPMMGGKTVIAIARRWSTIARMDRIVVLWIVALWPAGSPRWGTMGCRGGSRGAVRRSGLANLAVDSATKPRLLKRRSYIRKSIEQVELASIKNPSDLFEALQHGWDNRVSGEVFRCLRGAYRNGRGSLVLDEFLIVARPGPPQPNPKVVCPGARSTPSRISLPSFESRI